VKASGQLRLGVIAVTHKENEHRLPIHPEHLDRIDKNVVGNVYLERGYGEHFGISDKRCCGAGRTACRTRR
jgi:alanine dehydrogenase